MRIKLNNVDMKFFKYFPRLLFSDDSIKYNKYQNYILFPRTNEKPQNINTK